MSRLEEIKEEFAKAKKFDNWTDFINDEAHWMIEKHMDKVCEIYAKECSQASLEKACEMVELVTDYQDWAFDRDKVDKSSITNPENIVIL